MRKLIKGETDLLTTHPELAKQWHPTLNAGLKDKNGVDISSTDKVMSSSKEKAWWLCPVCNQAWQTVINYRAKGTGCPYCSGLKAIPGKNDFETLHPELATQFHPILNGTLKLSELKEWSKRKVWWICEFGHIWETSVHDRTNGRNCPECAKRKNSSFPQEAIYYYIKQHFSDAILSERKVLDKQEIDVYIPSLKTGIEYDGYFYHQDSKQDENKNKLSQNKGIKLIRVREFRCPTLNDGIAQIIIREDNVLNSSLEEAIRKLLKQLGLNDVDVDIKRDYDKIFQEINLEQTKKTLPYTHPHIAAEWHQTKNGTLKPEMITCQFRQPVWWQCLKGHEWQAIPRGRCATNHGCPFCAGQLTVSGENDIQTTLPWLAREWHPSKNIGLTDKKGRDISTPDKVSAGSHQKVWWRCPVCLHEWASTVKNRSHGSKCPECSKKQRQKKGFQPLIKESELVF